MKKELKEAEIQAVRVLLRGLKKHKGYDEILNSLDEDYIAIPKRFLQNRKLGILEAVTLYLKEKLSYRYSQIAKLLKRDQRTIWCAYNNAKKKLKK